ncbi:hypothetical protein O9K51_02006 [Purpureocillium lavendulum]|uniref:Acriflavine sensitivity control protein acr-2 n=1 Tax=Purpureocillium lavendulum TaxID=1247861 RepID=A0AB34G929_9HYPO|nr:hypothetical protein O9K51_02006 [Purpureocillium lavendulum]
MASATRAPRSNQNLRSHLTSQAIGPRHAIPIIGPARRPVVCYRLVSNTSRLSPSIHPPIPPSPQRLPGNDKNHGHAHRVVTARLLLPSADNALISRVESSVDLLRPLGSAPFGRRRISYCTLSLQASGARNDFGFTPRYTARAPESTVECATSVGTTQHSRLAAAARLRLTIGPIGQVSPRQRHGRDGQEPRGVRVTSQIGQRHSCECLGYGKVFIWTQALDAQGNNVRPPPPPAAAASAGSRAATVSPSRYHQDRMERESHRQREQQGAHGPYTQQQQQQQQQEQRPEGDAPQAQRPANGVDTAQQGQGWWERMSGHDGGDAGTSGDGRDPTGAFDGEFEGVVGGEAGAAAAACERSAGGGAAAGGGGGAGGGAGETRGAREPGGMPVQDKEGHGFPHERSFLRQQPQRHHDRQHEHQHLQHQQLQHRRLHPPLLLDQHQQVEHQVEHQHQHQHQRQHNQQQQRHYTVPLGFLAQQPQLPRGPGVGSVSAASDAASWYPSPSSAGAATPGDAASGRDYFAPRGRVALSALTDPVFQDLDRTSRYYLAHFADHVCKDLVARDGPGNNPFRELIPLTTRHPLLLHILVATSAIHWSNLFRPITTIPTGLTDPGGYLAQLRAKDLVSRAALIDALTAKQTAMLHLRQVLDTLDPAGSEVALAAMHFFIRFDLIDLERKGDKGWLTHLDGARSILALLSPAAAAASSSSRMLRDCVIADCFIYHALGSTLASGALAARIARYAVEVLPVLERVETNSYLSCPAAVLQVILRASEFSYESESFGTTLTLGAAEEALELIHSLREFDMDAWAAKLRTDVLSRVHVASAHRGAACLYVLQALPLARAASVVDPDSLVDEILMHLSQLDEGDPYFKATSWPTFIAGAETRDPDKRMWTLKRLLSIWKICSWGYIFTAIEMLKTTWDMQDRQDAAVSRDGSSRGSVNWLKDLKAMGFDYLIV